MRLGARKILKILKTLLLGTLIIGWPSSRVYASEMVELGAPQNDGIIKVDATVLGMSARAELRIKKGMDPKVKAAMITQLFNGGGILVVNPPNSSVIEAPGETGTIRVISDESNENIKLTRDVGDPKGLVGLIGFAGVLSGTDSDGSVSIFQASLGFDGLLAESSVSFTDLPVPSLDGLLEELFEQLVADLPTSLQPSLALDLGDHLITVNFPSGQTNYFVQSNVTDISVSSSLALTPVPGPSSLLLSCAGLFAMAGCHVWSKRSRRIGCSASPRCRGTDGIRSFRDGRVPLAVEIERHASGLHRRTSLDGA